MENSPVLADGGKRAIAFIIDILLIGVVNGILFFVAMSMGIGGAASTMNSAATTDESYASGLAMGAIMASGMVQILSIVIWFGYHIFMETSAKQATIGKSIMGLKVGNLDGSKMEMGTAVIRNLVKYISLIPCGLGILVGFFTQNKQGLQDMAAKTNVFVQ